MSKPRRYPAMPGGCACDTVKFRLETIPLFVYACHCTDCQKETGSAFAVSAQIEADLIKVTSETKPQIILERTTKGLWKTLGQCPKCRTVLWRAGSWAPGLMNVSVGCLDHPNYLPPDIHSFVDNKLDWVLLPEDAVTAKARFDPEKVWPKISRLRLEAFKKRYDAAAAEGITWYETEAEAEKTPTAETPEEQLSDEELDKRYAEREKELQERLEQLTLKLSHTERPPVSVAVETKPSEAQTSNSGKPNSQVDESDAKKSET
ncbi:hypothetical protein BU24DRAFT_167720 [Aaosphaeria arxii CBS 175.79]|uniref:CENP-V/GFA domain-containing protein n=1 Tax=Aaosphaeria arxii CBS 175.79 TaxID=1450172 RepID=A0A6A5XZC3_9PLEO|nr:uncharacterized protein BU24DRAFT_167720 [Aaosphaeria arxii CBS 175.79]KAF2018253.1 hypothetical protein BU24DRAFT_167720 [Aaosphaeria arxii CBS 175.79]